MASAVIITTKYAHHITSLHIWHAAAFDVSIFVLTVVLDLVIPYFWGCSYIYGATGSVNLSSKG